LLQSDKPPSQDVEVEVRPPHAPQYAAIVSLRGEHDLATAPVIRDALSPVFGDVLVDLSDCTFVDSTVIGALIAASQELEREGHALALVVPPENADVARTLEIVHIGALVRILPQVPGTDGAGPHAV
jgi:anti-anti-sigma factor